MIDRDHVPDTLSHLFVFLEKEKASKELNNSHSMLLLVKHLCKYIFNLLEKICLSMRWSPTQCLPCSFGLDPCATYGQYHAVTIQPTCKTYLDPTTPSASLSLP